LNISDTPYREFARVYDDAMSGIPYERWIDYVERLVNRHGIAVTRVLDLACGTGNTTLPWVERGYSTTGVDGSPHMLGVAEEKARSRGLHLPLYCQDMRELDLKSSFDLITCLYDSMNYVLSPEDLGQVFRRVAAHLCPGGLFVFDMNSQNKLASISDKTIHIEGVGWDLIWEEGYRDELGCWEVELTGFIEVGDSPGLFRKFHEVHHERGYSIATTVQLLEGSGSRDHLQGVYPV